MQSSSPLLANRDAEPNLELLRRMGWSVGNTAGIYCLAWRGSEEVVFEWQGGGWQRLSGRGGADEV